MRDTQYNMRMFSAHTLLLCTVRSTHAQSRWIDSAATKASMRLQYNSDAREVEKSPVRGRVSITGQQYGTLVVKVVRYSLRVLQEGITFIRFRVHAQNMFSARTSCHFVRRNIILVLFCASPCPPPPSTTLVLRSWNPPPPSMTVYRTWVHPNQSTTAVVAVVSRMSETLFILFFSPQIMFPQLSIQQNDYYYCGVRTNINIMIIITKS